MVDELAQERDRLEWLGLFAAQEGLHDGRLHKVLVELELERREAAEDDVLILDRHCIGRSVALHKASECRRTVLGEEIVGAADDELGHERVEFLELLVAELLLLVGRLAIATFGDRVLKVFVEVNLGAEVARVAKVEEREVLVEVVLDRRAREDDAALAVEVVQRRVRLVLCGGGVVSCPALLSKGQPRDAPEFLRR